MKSIDVLPVSRLETSDQELVKLALDVRRRAYAPYSKFLVGCALRDELGGVHIGCNVENASYSAAICAERVALTAMVSSGQRVCKRVALVTSCDEPCFPCGVCRQMLQELAPDAVIIAVDQSGTVYSQTTTRELLPSAFSKDKLIE